MTLDSSEITRRAIWNFFRMENEHLTNCDGFRYDCLSCYATAKCLPVCCVCTRGLLLIRLSVFATVFLCAMSYGVHIVLLYISVWPTVCVRLSCRCLIIVCPCCVAVWLYAHVVSRSDCMRMLCLCLIVCACCVAVWYMVCACCFAVWLYAHVASLSDCMSRDMHLYCANIYVSDVDLSLSVCVLFMSVSVFCLSVSVSIVSVSFISVSLYISVFTCMDVFCVFARIFHNNPFKI